MLPTDPDAMKLLGSFRRCGYITKFKRTLQPITCVFWKTKSDETNEKYSTHEVFS